jgi:hypothetical protein
MSADGRKRISKMMKLNIFRFVGNSEVVNSESECCAVSDS